MIPKPKHDIYFRHEEDGFFKVAWIKEFKDFELMIGFYGLDGNDPLLAYEYKDRNVHIKELNQLKIPHKEAISAGNLPVDHFTFHSDKQNRPGIFQLKYGAKNYDHKVKSIGKINENSPVILDFFIISDVTSKYTHSSTNPDPTDIIIPIPSNNIGYIRVQCSGKNFDLLSIVGLQSLKQNLVETDAIILEEKTLQIVFTYGNASLSEEAINNKNDGTYFSITFGTGNDNFLLKTFIFK